MLRPPPAAAGGGGRAAAARRKAQRDPGMIPTLSSRDFRQTTTHDHGKTRPPPAARRPACAPGCMPGRWTSYRGMVTAIAGEYRFGPECGRLVLKTVRAGLAAKVGHDLTIEVTRWSAHAVVPGEDQGGLAAVSLSAEADLGSLTTREGVGGAMPLSQADRDEIDSTARKILTGRGNATATFESSQVSVMSDGEEIDGTITINDIAQPLRLRLTEQGPGHYLGTGTITQSAHGIKPYSGFFGTLKLKDEVGLEFDVDLTKARPVQE